MTTARYAYDHVSAEILSEDMQFADSAPGPDGPSNPAGHRLVHLPDDRKLGPDPEGPSCTLRL